ncbi:hypothetical protein C1645_824458 [Glomus cerebriforme]|uniref:Uncharacterized protein n=1 Tax=Glomus cerebriforme TaxID=658196 RepID=A0A397SUE2_9GLOM|nr:hypothetical protein C1645_824458 [Glomus cerebriforme]
MSAITTKFVTDYQLTNEMSIEKLRYQFSKEQVFALIPDQRNGRYISQVPVMAPEAEVNISLVSDNAPEGKTIKETTQRIIQNNLNERDVKAISRTLVKTTSGPVASLNYLSRLRRKLENLNAPEKIISATKIPNITKESNKIQKECKSVKERLDKYNVFNIPDKQALANEAQDISQVFRILEKNEERARQLLTWIQEAIFSRQLRDPEKPGSVYLNAFLKKDEFLPKSDKPLLPSYLRKLGVMFAVVSNGVKNLSEVMTIASQAFNIYQTTMPLQRKTI